MEVDGLETGSFRLVLLQFNVPNLQIDVEAGLNDHKPPLAALEQQFLSYPPSTLRCRLSELHLPK
jgi:hypothetical protein